MAGGDRKEAAYGELTHLDEKGRARMVDVSEKEVTTRTAQARARVLMKDATLELIRRGGVEKGDVLAVARVAGIMAAKRAGELIPLCHPLSITSAEVEFKLEEQPAAVEISVTVKTRDRTGVEMEALVGAAVAALTIYDMCKAVDRAMTVTDLQLVRKSGGRSGTFLRSG